MNKIPLHFQTLQGTPLLPKEKNVTKPSSTSFKALLAEQTLKVSKHAKARLYERKIEINDQQWLKIKEKMTEANSKGVNDSLVLVNDAALLVSTKNNTVVTAMSMEEATSKIFTNINGAIIISD